MATNATQRGVLNANVAVRDSKLQNATLKGYVTINDDRIQMTSLKGRITLPEIISTGDCYLGKTIILEDDYGHEFTAVFADAPITLDATANDIRLGKSAATVEGVTLGEKEIPTYHTIKGHQIIMPGNQCLISVVHYNYTQLQALFCLYESSIMSSVYTNKVTIGNKVYAVNSTEELSSIEVDESAQKINLGIINDTDTPYVIRYFTYKEIY